MNTKSGVLEAELVCSTTKASYIDVIVPQSWRSDFDNILVDDVKVSFNPSFLQSYLCPREGCLYEATRRENVEQHESRHDSDRMTYKCAKFGHETGSKTLLKGIFPEDYYSENVVLFDIESLMQKENSFEGHKVVMIAAKRNYIDETTRVLTRMDLTANGLKTLIKDFVDLLVDWLVGHMTTFPEKVIKFLDRAEEKIKNPNISVPLKEWYSKRLHAIKAKMELKILGFNSMKYDMVVISNALIDEFINRFGEENLQVVKKGTGFFLMKVQTEHGIISFRDVLSYTSGQSLDTFVKSWRSDEEVIARANGVWFEDDKLTWPYTGN